MTTKTLFDFPEEPVAKKLPPVPAPPEYLEQSSGFTTADSLPKIPLKVRLKSIKRMAFSVQEKMTREAINEAIRSGEIKRTEEATPILREANPALFKMMKDRLSTRQRDPEKEKVDRRGE